MITDMGTGAATNGIKTCDSAGRNCTRDFEILPAVSFGIATASLLYHSDDF